MSKQIVAAEISRERVPSELYALFGFNEQRVKAQLNTLITCVDEVFILSTPQRFAVYAVHSDIAPLTDFFCRDKEMLPYVNYYTNTEESIHHFFATAARLGSGAELEIIKEINRAYNLCSEIGCLGLVLDNLVVEAVRVGRSIQHKVRDRTAANLKWELVMEETLDFIDLLKRIQFTPVLATYWTRITGVNDQDFNWSSPLLGNISEDDKEIIKKYASAFNFTSSYPGHGPEKNTIPINGNEGDTTENEKLFKHLQWLYNVGFTSFFQN